MFHKTSIQVTGKCTYHGDHILVCKLVAEVCARSDPLDGILSGGLCGIVVASECGSGDFVFVPLAVTRSRSCVIVSIPSVGLLVDESPRRGLSKVVCGSVRLFTTAASEGNKENDDSVDAAATATGFGDCSAPRCGSIPSAGALGCWCAGGGASERNGDGATRERWKRVRKSFACGC